LRGEPNAVLHVISDMEIATRPYTNGGRSEYDRLREAYDHAFHELSEASKMNSGVAAAERKYNERRDALFQFLMSGTPSDQHARAVERLAYVL
jgi:hypothetical protein